MQTSSATDPNSTGLVIEEGEEHSSTPRMHQDWKLFLVRGPTGMTRRRGGGGRLLTSIPLSVVLLITVRLLSCDSARSNPLSLSPATAPRQPSMAWKQAHTREHGLGASTHKGAPCMCAQVQELCAMSLSHALEHGVLHRRHQTGMMIPDLVRGPAQGCAVEHVCHGALSTSTLQAHHAGRLCWCSHGRPCSAGPERAPPF